MALEEKSFEELEKWVTRWMESRKPDMEFHADKNGTYMYTAPSGNSKINLKYFFTSVLEDYLAEQEELSDGNPSNEESALPIAGVRLSCFREVLDNLGKMGEMEFEVWLNSQLHEA